jgi:O-antigen/teichoic acid export membrane protein
MKRAIILAGASRAGSAVLMLALNVFLVRFAGPDQYGVFVTLITIASFVALFCRLGLDTLLIKETAVAATQSMHSNFYVRQVYRYHMTATVGTVFLISVFLLLRESSGIASSIVGLESILAIITVVTVIGPLGIALTRGLGYFRTTEVLDAIIKPVLVVLFCLTLHFSGARLDATTITLTTAAVMLLIIFVCHGIFLRRFNPLRVSSNSKENTEREAARWIPKGAASVVGLGLASFGLFQLDKLVLAWYAPPSAVGAYVTCSNFTRIVAFVPLILYARYMPELAVRLKCRFTSHSKSIINRIASWALASASFGFALLALAGPTVLSFTSESYRGFYNDLLILGVSQIFNAYSIIAQGAMLMGNRHRFALLAQASGSAVTCGLIYPLYLHSSTTGVASAVLAGTIVSMLASFGLLRKAHNENLSFR